jgi:hypothetical protein
LRLRTPVTLAVLVFGCARASSTTGTSPFRRSTLETAPSWTVTPSFATFIRAARHPRASRGRERRGLPSPLPHARRRRHLRDRVRERGGAAPRLQERAPQDSELDDDETHTAIQIYGSDAPRLAEAARVAIDLFCTKSYVTEARYTVDSCKMRISWV